MSLRWPRPEHRLPLAALALGLLLSAVAASWLHLEARRDARMAFDRHAERVGLEIQRRLELSAVALGSMAAVLAAEPEAARVDFDAWAAAQALPQRLPGLRAIGLSAADPANAPLPGPTVGPSFALAPGQGFGVGMLEPVRRDGLAYAHLRAVLALDALLADIYDARPDRVSFALSESPQAGPLFDSAAGPPGREQLARTLTVPGREWWLQVRSTPEFDRVEGRSDAWPVFGLGLMASLLVAALLWQQTRGRGRAEALAARLAPEAEMMALLASQTSDIVIVTDLARRITWVNQEFERVTGYSGAEVRGRSPGELLQFGGTDAATVQRMREALDAGLPFHGEILNLSRAGREYWLELKIQPLRNAAGQLTGFIAVESDITERKRDVEALRASQAFLDTTGRIAGVGGWSFDLRSGEMRFSDQTCRILGREPGFMPTVADCLAHATDEARRQFEAATGSGRDRSRWSWDLELPLLTAQGRRIWVRVAAEAEFADAGPVRVVGALQDITRRREIEADAQRNAGLLRGAIETIDEAFVLYDPDDRLVFCNEKYLQVYDRSRDLMVPGTRFEDIIRIGAERGQYPAAIGRVDEWVARRLASHRTANHTLVQQLDDGRVVRIVERTMPDGHRVGFRVDITDLVRATEAAERADRAKSEFIATISHELRTPLQSIMGFSDLGRHFAQGHPQYETMFNDIHAGGQRMLKLVNGLLDVSKIDGGPGSLNLRRTDVTALAAEVVRELRPLAAPRQIRIEMPADSAPAWAEADAFRLQQVVRNLLANAIRFAPEGSAVELWTRHDAGIELFVRDHGPGIPAQELESIFDAFVQSSRTRDGAGGTGLGLTISRKIVGAHGGRIEARNAEGGGALFRVWLPAAPELDAPHPARTLKPLRAPRAETVSPAL